MKRTVPECVCDAGVRIRMHHEYVGKVDVSLPSVIGSRAEKWRACVYLQSELAHSAAKMGPIIVHSLPCQSDPTRLGSP